MLVLAPRQGRSHSHVACFRAIAAAVLPATTLRVPSDPTRVTDLIVAFGFGPGRAADTLKSSASVPRQQTLVIPPPPTDSAHVPLQFRSFGKFQYQRKWRTQLPGG